MMKTISELCTLTHPCTASYCFRGGTKELTSQTRILLAVLISLSQVGKVLPCYMLQDQFVDELKEGKNRKDICS